MTIPRCGQLLTSYSGDPPQISIDLLNATSTVPKPILENIAHNLNTTDLGVNITWPYNVPNETATYQLYFIATASGSDVANSGAFNLTLPPGENRTEAGGTVGPYGTHPDTDFAPKGSAPDHLSKGAIAGIVVGAVGALALVIGALAAFLIYRRRRNGPVDQDDDSIRKAELDGSTLNEKRGTLQTITSEIGSSDKPPNYLRWELPSSPPSIPVELPDNEIPAFEMSTGTTMLTLAKLEDATSEDHKNNEVAHFMQDIPNSRTSTSANSLEANRDPAQTPQSRTLSIGSMSTECTRLSP